MQAGVRSQRTKLAVLKVGVGSAMGGSIWGDKDAGIGSVCRVGAG